ncbi:dihydroorotate oxidase B, catalytic subunit [Archaeoglobus sulfaticallidus PM70-1]|uniref:Dihydroorotate dehydrogenase n=1 Tax=Archaeoglobus sulfaticallidus PM70-1 TaxID=387631 RepID=N0BDV1_9EURY|nr:dihydroorotate dehydrogenase [Archaeoglobus sulfaticallidus]AGK60407.1 dihydroorotate oxidase B, catalytic subunit [Archaeoglobus sulfaticallidus PM70-1]
MLEVQISSLTLQNPLILASGILGSYSSSLNRLSEHAGALVAKSVGIEEREGYRNPVVVNTPHGLLNAVGLSSPGAEKFALELENYRGDAKLIVSLFASNPDEFVEIARYFDMADAFELNLSCPHVKGLGLTVGNDPELVGDIVRRLKKETSRPIFAKISAFSSYIEVAKSAEEAGVDGVVAINTLKGMAIDIGSKKPILSNVSGGYSGEAVKPVAMKVVWDLYEELDIPIIASGGATSWKDVVEFMLAGASAVQIGSAFFYSYRIFYSLKESLKAYARKEKIRLEEIIGLAHKK